MSNIVILAEKSSQKKDMEAALLKGRPSGKIGSDDVTVVASSGHIFRAKPPRENVPGTLSEKYGSWDIRNLPWEPSDFLWENELAEASPRARRTPEDIFEAICDAADGADELVIATDWDNTGEGDLLAGEIILAANFRGKLSRMHFVDQSAKELQKAYKDRETISSLPEHGNYVKALSRSRWDYLSMQWTRIATAFSRRAGYDVIPRQGRLKSAMIMYIGSRLDAVKNYVKVPFFEARYKDENGHTYKRKEDGAAFRKSKKEEVDLSPFGESSVTIDGTEKKRTAPGKYLDLAGLVAILATEGFSAKEVTDTYQKMYEANGTNDEGEHIGGYLSYPRTEDKTMTPEQFSEMLPLVDEIAEVVGVDPKLLTHRKPRRTHVKAEGSHGCNRPGKRVPEGLAELEAFGPAAVPIYTTLAKNFLASFAEDYEYEHQTGHITDHPEFVGYANIPVNQGFKAVFDTEAQTSDKKKGRPEDESAKPLGKKAKPFIHEGANPKPSAPTVKSLTKYLERYAVGTGATRSSTLSEITDDKVKDREKRQLAIEKRGKLTLAPCGLVSYELLKGTKIGDVKVTEDLFSKMDLIGKFEYDPDELLKSVSPMLMNDLKVMEQNTENIKKIDFGGQKAPLRKEGAQKERVTGSLGGTPVSFAREWSKHRFTDEEVTRLLAGEQIEIDAVSKRGKAAVCKGRLKMQEYNGKPFCGFKAEEIFTTEWSGHRFTKEEQEALVNGEQITIDAISGKTGAPFKCRGHLAKKLSEDGETTFYGFTLDDFEEGEGKESEYTCPACGKKVFEKGAKFTCECGFELWKLQFKKPLSKKDLDLLFERKRTGLIKGFTKKDGGKFDARLMLKEEDGAWRVVPTWDSDYICPACGKPLRPFAKGKGYGCTGWKPDGKGCEFKLFSTVSGHKLTAREIDTLFTKKETGPITFTSKDKKKYKARLAIEDDAVVIKKGD